MKLSNSDIEKIKNINRAYYEAIEEGYDADSAKKFHKKYNINHAINICYGCRYNILCLIGLPTRETVVTSCDLFKGKYLKGDDEFER